MKSPELQQSPPMKNEEFQLLLINDNLRPAFNSRRSHCFLNLLIIEPYIIEDQQNNPSAVIGCLGFRNARLMQSLSFVKVGTI